MPEGPSLVILKELVDEFEGHKVLEAGGNTKAFETSELNGKKLREFKTWGKHFLICFPDCTVRVHFMLFGSYRINERKENPARFSLRFDNGEINFYACSVKMLEAEPDEIYDWTADVMNPDFDEKKALKKLKSHPDMLACDALLDQNIFAGVGNIIKNEVLYRIGVQPESTLGAMPDKKLKEMVKEAVVYSFDFLRWKKAYQLKKNYKVHTKSSCPKHKIPLIKKYPGRTKRRSFYCEKCQKLYV